MTLFITVGGKRLTLSIMTGTIPLLHGGWGVFLDGKVAVTHFNNPKNNLHPKITCSVAFSCRKWTLGGTLSFSLGVKSFHFHYRV